MTRNLKHLFLAGAAAVVVAAVVAPSALAAPPNFNSEVEPWKFEGTQVVPLIVTVEGGVGIKCSSAEFFGTNATKVSETITSFATFTGCKFAGQNASVFTNGCSFTFRLVNASNPPSSKLTIECPAGKEIEVSSEKFACTVLIGENFGLGNVGWTNEGAGATRDLLSSWVVSKMIYEEKGKGCVKEGVFSNGEITGTATFKGYKDEGGVKGAQVGIWAA
jgi:hypothetical protein